MAKNILIEWVLPTARTGKTGTDGAALSVEDIDYVLVEMSANNGTNWSVVKEVPPTQLSMEMFDVDAGTYLFRGSVVPKVGPASEHLVETAEIPDESAPQPLGSLSVTVQ